MIPGESITDPYEVMRRLLWDTDVKLNSKVTTLEPLGETINIITTQGIINARYVINCAGLFADEFTQEFQITPRRGEFIAFEKGSTNLIKHILLPMPNEFTKGVLVFPTLHGYLCAGPSAEDQEDKTDWTPHKKVLPILHQKASEMVPALETMQSVSAWAGLRTVGHPHNYLIEYSKQIPQLLHVAGIRSTGLSACLGISDYVIKMLKDRGLRETSAAVFSKPVFSDSQPWWKRLNTLRKVDVKHVLNEGRKEEGGERKG